MNRMLDTPMSRLLVLAGLSTGMAILFYFVGGSIAEVQDQSGTFLGVTFKATGALGGFILVLLLLYWVLRRLETERPINVALQMTGKNRQFKDTEEYTATAYIFRDATRKEEEVSDLHPRRTNLPNHLLLYLDGVYPRDRVSVTVENERGISWRVKDFQVQEPMQEAERVGARSSPRRTQARKEVPVERPAVLRQNQQPGPVEASKTRSRQRSIPTVPSGRGATSGATKRGSVT